VNRARNLPRSNGFHGSAMRREREGDGTKPFEKAYLLVLSFLVDLLVWIALDP